MKQIMKEKNRVVSDEMLSKKFLSQFNTETDVSKFLMGEDYDSRCSQEIRQPLSETEKT